MEISNNNIKNDDFLDFDVKKQEKKQRILHIVRETLVYIFLAIVAIGCVFPFYWMLMTSFKTEAEYELEVPTPIPNKWISSNYQDAFKYHNGLFSQTLVNSLVVGIVSTLISLVLIILAAYAFARLKFPGKNFVFSALLMTMMIPGELYTTTNYITTVKDFNWANTFTIMIVPFLVSVYYIYLLRNTFMQIPESLYKAAKVDGCSDFKFLIKVMIPLAGPTIISITILKLIGVWNSYMWPQLVNEQNWRLVSNWMASCGATNEGTNYPIKMAAAVIISIPLFLVFVFFRKYIMKGVSKSGTKG